MSQGVWKYFKNHGNSQKIIMLVHKPELQTYLLTYIINILVRGPVTRREVSIFTRHSCHIYYINLVIFSFSHTQVGGNTEN